MSEIETGQGYRPYNLFHGSVIPYSLAARTDITAGAKLTWGELAALMGKAGFCKPSVEYLAERLGVSVDKVTRWLRELTTKHLIRSKRCGPGAHAERVFIWDSCLEKSLKGPIPETAKIPVQEDRLKQEKSRFKDGAETAKSRALKQDIRGPETGKIPVAYKEVEEVLLRGSKEEVLSSSAVLAVVDPVPTDDETTFSEKEKSETPDLMVTTALVETARQQLRMARAQCLDVPVERVKVPDRAITTRILGLFTELVDFETWLAGTLRTGLARKARDSRWGLYETDAFNHRADILQQRRTAEQRAADEAVEAEQQRAAEAAELVLLDTPMLALQAFGLIQRALNGSGVPKPLKAKLERTSELISPNDLKAAIRNWKRCPQCEDGGTVGHAFYGTLAFCTCLAGLEAGYDKGTDWPAEEIARVHSSTKNKLVAAARTRGAHLADAIEASTITETPSKLVFHAPKSYLLYFKDKGFTEVLKLAGEQRTWVVEMATEAVA